MDLFVFATGFFIWSAATAATGIAHTFLALFVLRLLLGMAESVAFPSYSKIISLNYPPERRGIANSAIASGLVLGPGFGMFFGGMLIGRFGWRAFFVALGLVSLLWLVPWFSFMPKKSQVIASDADTSDSPSLFEFLRMRSAWGTCVGLFCGNYLNYFLITCCHFISCVNAIFRWTTWPKSVVLPTFSVPVFRCSPVGSRIAGSYAEQRPQLLARHSVGVGSPLRDFLSAFPF